MIIDLPGGMKVEVRGISVLLTLLLVAVSAGGVILYFHEIEDKQFEDGLVQIVREMKDRQTEMNYILTLTPAEREKLKLIMPDSLRKRMREEDTP